MIDRICWEVTFTTENHLPDGDRRNFERRPGHSSTYAIPVHAESTNTQQYAVPVYAESTNTQQYAVPVYARLDQQAATHIE